jgi:hypothetical protein
VARALLARWAGKRRREAGSGKILIGQIWSSLLLNWRMAQAPWRSCAALTSSVYWWIKEWKVERLVDVLMLSRASGVPIEKLAAESIDPDNTAEPGKAAIKRTKPDSE